MATAVGNQLGDTISITEEQGSVVSATMSAHITGLAGASGTASRALSRDRRRIATCRGLVVIPALEGS